MSRSTYGETPGGLVVSRDIVIENLDLFAGPRMVGHYCFLFGIDIVEGRMVPAYGDLLQYDGLSWMIARAREDMERLESDLSAGLARDHGT